MYCQIDGSGNTCHGAFGYGMYLETLNIGEEASLQGPRMEPVD